MTLDTLAASGLVLLGCGKMGSAMLQGWLADGFPATSVYVLDPNPSDWLRETGVQINADLPDAPGVLLVAVKPQMMGEALPRVAGFGNGSTTVLSVAAGTTIAQFEAAFGAQTPVIRTIPNTPSAVGKGITAMVGNAHVTEDQMTVAQTLLTAIGQVVRLSHEDQIDAATGVSGSGPAYVFHMIECLAAAAQAEGLPPDIAMQLAKATVAGAGILAETAPDDPAQLRRNVTSPNGTTQAGLEVLMDEAKGLPPLMRATVRAATARSRDLRDG